MANLYKSENLWVDLVGYKYRWKVAFPMNVEGIPPLPIAYKVLNITLNFSQASHFFLFWRGIIRIFIFDILKICNGCV